MICIYYTTLNIGIVGCLDIIESSILSFWLQIKHYCETDKYILEYRLINRIKLEDYEFILYLTIETFIC